MVWSSLGNVFCSESAILSNIYMRECKISPNLFLTWDKSWLTSIKLKSEFLMQYKSIWVQNSCSATRSSCLGHHVQSKHRGLIWVIGMRHVRNKAEKKDLKKACATFNCGYLGVQCALQSVSWAGPWECNALAYCLDKCVPYVGAFYPSLLSSPQRGATRSIT